MLSILRVQRELVSTKDLGMLTLPVHTKTIATLEYDPHKRLLVARLRSGQLRSVKNFPVCAVLRMISGLPAEASTFLRPIG
jgi:hypothetical protein